MYVSERLRYCTVRDSDCSYKNSARISGITMVEKLGVRMSNCDREAALCLQVLPKSLAVDVG